MSETRRLRKGGKVWIRDADQAWTEGIVLGRSKKEGAKPHEIVVQVGKELKKRGAKTRVVDARTECEVRRTKSAKVYSRIEDLTSVETLHEPGLLEALEMRYAQDKIYTFTGKILLAVNPFKEIPGMYGRKVTQRYIEAGAGDELPAHAYAVASRAYKDVMERNGLNQTVLVSGESGAGKTETTKIIMRSITEMSQWRSGERRRSGGEAEGDEEEDDDHHYRQHTDRVASGAHLGVSGDIAERVLQSNPVLETFGNACTIRNDNSSRFGKLIALKFDRESGGLLGAHITTYLLEKARLTYQFAGERNFHVFYEMAAGGSDEELERWRFTTSLEPFDFVTQKDNLDREDQSDAFHFLETKQAMQLLGMEDEEIDNLFNIVAGVLHLGNVEFETFGNEQACRIKYDDSSMISCAACCELLQVDADALERSLCRRVIRIHGAGADTDGRPDPRNPYSRRENESFEKSLDVAEACLARDALAMTIYERMFGWLVWRLNQCIQVNAITRDAAASRKSKRVIEAEELVEIDDNVFRTNYTIGLLDVFGFEVFERNGFEQLCINYCNESLQQLFNDFVFRKDQLEYDEEGVDWDFIKYPDNKACIEMIESKPIGLFSLIDENCMYPQGNDTTMVNKMYEHLAGTFKRFLAPTKEERAAHCFTIRHFAGDVTYHSNGFFRKNKNELRQEAVDLVSASRNPIVSILLPQEAKDAAGGADIASYFDAKLGSNFAGAASALSEPRFSPPASGGSAGRRGGAGRVARVGRAPQAIQQKTVGSHFKIQLKVAIDNIRASNPHYVRCLKPNDENVPQFLDRKRLVAQLRYSGVLQVIQVARAGYPYRFTFAEFLERYAVLGKKGAPYKARRLAEKASVEIQKRNCIKIANQAQLVHGDEYQAGKSKVFLRQFTFTILEVMKEDRLWQLALVVQRAAKRFLQFRRENPAPLRKKKKTPPAIETAKPKNRSPKAKAVSRSNKAVPTPKKGVNKTPKAKAAASAMPKNGTAASSKAKAVKTGKSAAVKAPAVKAPVVAPQAPVRARKKASPQASPTAKDSLKRKEVSSAKPSSQKAASPKARAATPKARSSTPKARALAPKASSGSVNSGKQQQQASKKVVKKTRVVKEEDEEDLSSLEDLSGSDEEDEVSSEVDDVDSEQEDDEEEYLTDSSQEEVEEEAPPPRKSRAGAKKAASNKSKKATSKVEEEEEDYFDDDDDVIEVPNRTRGREHSIYSSEEEDDDDDEVDESEEEEQEDQVAALRQGSRQSNGNGKRSVKKSPRTYDTESELGVSSDEELVKRAMIGRAKLDHNRKKTRS